MPRQHNQGLAHVRNGPRRFNQGAADSAAMSSLKASGAVFALYDASSYSNMWQDTAGTTTQAAAGQPVGYLKNIKTAASAWHAIAPADANRPVATNGLTITGASQQRLHTAKVGTPATLTVICIVKNLGAVGALGGDSGGGFVEFGHYASADAGTPNNNAGAPTYIVDGAGVASTRAALYTALTAAGAHIVQVQSVSGANLAGVSWGATPGYSVYTTGIYIPVAVLDPAHASYATALADAVTVAGEIKTRIGL